LSSRSHTDDIRPFFLTESGSGKRVAINPHLVRFVIEINDKTVAIVFDIVAGDLAAALAILSKPILFSFRSTAFKIGTGFMAGAVSSSIRPAERAHAAFGEILGRVAHGSPVPRNWHWQNPSKAVISASPRPSLDVGLIESGP
jgi:hypothetical protein